MKEETKATGRYKLLPSLKQKDSVPDKKTCKKCKKEKPIAEFAKNSSFKDGHAGVCKKCFNEKTRAKVKEMKGGFPF